MATTNREKLMKVLEEQAQMEADKRLQLKTEHKFKQSAMERQQLRQKQKQEEVESWKHVSQNAQELINRGHQGFDNWVSAMLQIFGLSHKLAIALNASNPVVKKIRELNDEFLTSPLYQSLVYQKDRFFSQKPETHIPRYTIGVEFTDDDTLDLDSLKDTLHLLRSDGKEASQNERHLFVIAITAWLKENGYEPRPDDPLTYADRDGNQLTKSDFEALRDHPERGLVPFIRGDHFFGEDLELETSSVPTPTPS